MWECDAGDICGRGCASKSVVIVCFDPHVTLATYTTTKSNVRAAAISARYSQIAGAGDSICNQPNCAARSTTAAGTTAVASAAASENGAVHGDSSGTGNKYCAASAAPWATAIVIYGATATTSRASHEW
jgi:hypothetical protein